MTLFKRTNWKSEYFLMKVERDLALDSIIQLEKEYSKVASELSKLKAGLSTVKVKANHPSAKDKKVANPKRTTKVQK